MFFIAHFKNVIRTVVGINRSRSSAPICVVVAAAAAAAVALSFFPLTINSILAAIESIGFTNSFFMQIKALLQERISFLLDICIVDFIRKIYDNIVKM